MQDEETQRERAKLWNEVRERSIVVNAKLTMIGENEVTKSFSEIQRGYDSLGRQHLQSDVPYSQDWSDRSSMLILQSIMLTHHMRAELGIDPLIKTEDDLYNDVVIG